MTSRHLLKYFQLYSLKNHYSKYSMAAANKISCLANLFLEHFCTYFLINFFFCKFEFSIPPGEIQFTHIFLLASKFPKYFVI